MNILSKRINLLLLGFLGIALFSFSGCHKESNCMLGNGYLQFEERKLPAFTEVVNSGSFMVHIVAADKYEVGIQAESNIMPFVLTRISNGSLYIEMDNSICFNQTSQIIINVYMPFIQGIEMRGSGSTTVSDMILEQLNVGLSGSGSMYVNVEASQINAGISGSGNINLVGSSQSTNLSISGSGNIKAYDLEQKECFAKVSGSGNMYVTVDDFLNAEISGSGNIYFRGNPDVIQKITGSGRVIHQ